MSRVVGLVVAGQDSVLTLGVAKDKIFSNPAALPWFCRQELPRVRGILTLSRICCWRDFSLIGRRGGTQWRALRAPFLPDSWPWTTGSPWGLSAPELSCCSPLALLPGPAGPACPVVSPLLCLCPCAIPALCQHWAPSISSFPCAPAKAVCEQGRDLVISP